MSQRIGFLSFSQKKKKTTQRIELSPKIRYKELNFFFQYDSKIFSNMTRRIEPFFITWLKDLVFFTKKKLKEFDFLWLTDLNLLFKIFFQKMTRRIDPFFFTMTLKMEFFFEVRIRITELYFFNTNHRIDFFQNWIIFFWIRLEELKFSNTTQRIQLFFLWYDSKNWTFLVFQCDSMNSLRKTGKKFNALRQVRKKLNSSSQIIKGSILWVQIQKQKEVQFFESCEEKFNFEEKNQFFDFFSTQISIESHSKKWDRFIESYSKKSEFDSFESYSKRSSILWIIFLKEVNSLSYFQKKKEDKFFESCQKKFIWKRGYILWDIFEKKDFNWAFSKFGSKNWIGFFFVTQRIELFSLIWLTELTLFFVWLSELNFFKYDSVKWTFFFSNTTHRIDFFFWQEWLKELNLLLMRRKELNLFLICLEELMLFSKCDSGGWTFLFLQYDSKNWTFFCMAHRIEPLFLELWLKELNNFLWLIELNVFLSMIQRIESLFEDDSKNRTLFWIRLFWIEPSLTWLEDLIFFFFLKNDSKNWAFLKNTIQRTELFFDMTQFFFFKIWLEEFNPSFYHDSKTLLLFLEKIKEFDFYDSQTWTFFFFWIFFSKKKKDSKNWAFFLNYDSQNVFFWSTNATHGTDFFFNTTHRIDLFFEYDFFFWHWTFFFEFDSKNWNLQYDSEE